MSYKVQVVVDDDIEIWIKAESKKLGISISALCKLALFQYKDQKEMMGNMPKMMDLLNVAMSQKVKELENKK